MRSQALLSATRRVRVLEVLLVGGFLLLAARAGQLTVMATPQVIGRAEGQPQRSLNLPGARGLILDRDHRELAISVEAPSVYVHPSLLADRDATAEALARILERPAVTLAKRIGKRDRFVYLARWITRDQAERIEALGLRGVGIENEPKRTYPSGPMAACLIGFVDLDGRGRRGVEQMMDGWLRARPQRVSAGRDARGRVLPREGLDPRETAGGDIVLAIDAALQAQAESALARSIAKSGAQRGLVVVVEPKSGDILTLAEAPSFDPNRFRALEYADTRSRSFSDAIEPGSTFKAFLIAGALEAGVLDADTIIDTGAGMLQVPGKLITDKNAIGATDARGVLRHSSNVGAVLIAQALGSENYHSALDRFGFGSNSGSGFPSESAGLMRGWRKWKPVDQANVAFGQGINVTAVQLAMAAAALANDGERMRPRIVIKQRRPLGDWETLPPVSAGRAMDAPVAQSVLKMLEAVVSAEGTGRRAALAGVQVAGKTGTAQLLDPSGVYSSTRHTAWFVGFAPAEDPKVAIVVALEEPRGGGGTVAAPLFAEVAAAQLARYGIITQPEPIRAAALPRVRMVSAPPASRTPSTPGQPRAVAELELAQAPSAARVRSASLPLARAAGPQSAVFVPDFQGTSLGSARNLAAAESLDLRITGSGTGRVISQQPAPGTILGGNRRTVVVSFAPDQGEG